LTRTTPVSVFLISLTGGASIKIKTQESGERECGPKVTVEVQLGGDRKRTKARQGFCLLKMTCPYLAFIGNTVSGGALLSLCLVLLQSFILISSSNLY